MKKAIALTLCAAMLAICFTGCVSVNIAPFDRSVAGIGDTRRYDYAVGSFNEIRVSMHCDVVYGAAPSEIVTLDIQPNLHGYVKVEVNDGVLDVYTSETLSWSGKMPVLRVSAPVLNKLSLFGAGNIKVSDKIAADSFTLEISGAGNGKIDMDVETLSVTMNGAGNYELTGSAGAAAYEMEGAGNLDALSLLTRDADIAFSGVGSIKVNSSDSLRVRANGIGSIEYKGSPVLDIDKDGLVNIRKIN
jgi:hypothetical protein